MTLKKPAVESNALERNQKERRKCSACCCRTENKNTTKKIYGSPVKPEAGNCSNASSLSKCELILVFIFNTVVTVPSLETYAAHFIRFVSIEQLECKGYTNLECHRQIITANHFIVAYWIRCRCCCSLCWHFICIQMKKLVANFGIASEKLVNTFLENWKKKKNVLIDEMK